MMQAYDISAGYAGNPVIHSASLQVNRGEFVGLIGPNGAGKSTLLRALTGALPPLGGSIQIAGRSLHSFNQRELARNIAFVPQSEPTLFEFSVREVVLMGRTPHIQPARGETSADHHAVALAMAATDTLHLAERPITSLSGGEHRRVLMARALAQNAPLFVLDEPTAHLDMTHQSDLLRLIRRLVDREGVSALAALHDLNLAAEYCDRLLLLSGGKIIRAGTPQEVLTPELLSRVYGAPIRVSVSPATGKPYVFPAPPMPSEDSAITPRVHVICGGGSGPGIFSALLRRGFHISVGVLNLMDSDEKAAQTLELEAITDAPYSRISQESRNKCLPLLLKADAVIVAECPFGNGNLINLEMAQEALACGVRTFLIGNCIEERDFTGGQASRLWDQLLASGALPVPTVLEMEAILSTLSQAKPQMLE